MMTLNKASSAGKSVRMWTSISWSLAPATPASEALNKALASLGAPLAAAEGFATR